MIDQDHINALFIGIGGHLNRAKGKIMKGYYREGLDILDKVLKLSNEGIELTRPVITLTKEEDVWNE